MYNEFYSFKESPFNVTADPSFFFSSSRHADAYAHIMYGITQRKGILIITGEIGTGKTTLCRNLLSMLDSNTKSALILNPKFSHTQLLQFILKDFGLDHENMNKFALVNTLNEFLLYESSRGNNVIVIIDEAQNLSVNQLEAIRLLSNLETEKEKLLQILLVGQPELCKKLKLPSLRQLNQRVAVRYHIQPLDKNELCKYINHRLEVAVIKKTQQNPINFSEKAIDAIYAYTKGTPRMINILCDRALLAGYLAETRYINESIISECAREVFDS